MAGAAAGKSAGGLGEHSEENALRRAEIREEGDWLRRISGGVCRLPQDQRTGTMGDCRGNYGNGKGRG